MVTEIAQLDLKSTSVLQTLHLQPGANHPVIIAKN
jgi:hypothetical protein